MSGEDHSSARLAVPPEEPLPATALRPATLRKLATPVAERTAPLLREWFWGEGVCLLGLIRYAEAAGEPFPAAVTEFLDRHPAPTVDHVNHLAPGIAALLAWRATGEHRYAEQARRLLAWYERQPRTDVLEHWPGGVWADTVFMAGVFLAHAGVALDRPDLLAEAGRQLVRHGEVLQHDNGLLAHGSHRGETIWCFWGRANAWYALACVEFLTLAADTDVPGLGELVEEVRARLRRQLLALAEVQPAHGVWDVLVDGQPENRGILETSATAGIGAAMLRAGPLLPDLPEAVVAAGRLAVRGALAYLDDGVLTRVSAGTVLQLAPFGYSVIRDDRIQPWGQGLALHALAAALQHPDGEPADRRPVTPHHPDTGEPPMDRRQILAGGYGSPDHPGSGRLAPDPRLVETGVMAILRDRDASGFGVAAETLVEAGVRCVEFTLTTPGCLDALRAARDRLPDTVALGVGTVTAAEQVAEACRAGAGFVVAPNTGPDVIAAAVEHGVPCYPGAWTPTEVLAAWRAGASAVKLFPASVTGPGYLRQLRGPLPDVPLLPTGGVTVDQIGDYVRAGAIGVGLGGPLFGRAPIGEDLPGLADRARRALDAVAAARGESS